MRWVFAALVAILLLVRVPSLAQPAGGDQGLYAYVGQAIARGELPYRDAWDQKPPAIHYTYALMFRIWPNESVVAATDLLLAGLVAILLVPIGRRLSGQRGPGEVAALLFLLLGNPAFGRLGGVWVRAQCETFIAAAVAAAVLSSLGAASGEEEATRASARRGLGGAVLAGVFIGIAFLYKYNAAVYLVVPAGVVVVALWQQREPRRRGRLLWRHLSALLAGFLAPLAVAAMLFAAAGGLHDLVDATVVYNLQYSGETYAGLAAALRYLIAFPIRYARIDSLWLLGGVGSAALLLLSARVPRRVIAPVWVAAACVAIAINGSRGLPQYFVQAAPALSLAAGFAAVLAWSALGTAGRLVFVTLLVVAVLRVSPFDKAIDATLYDTRFLRGRVPAREYLARFGGQRPTDKFSALATRELGDYLRARTRAADRVLVFGFSAGAYVRADRLSASRFFWSRPVLVGFNEGEPGYGASGLLAELKAARPKIVVLQQHDWPAERTDSATYFLSTPSLAGWLHSEYEPVADTGTYLIWARRSAG
jgi:4-amino-4-deoxy-L-arabinose transferase-like glycosyltransferase